MSNRKTLIDALRQITSATLPELVDATGWPERKVRDTIGDCRTAGLVSSERDDVTGKPLYRLTKAGAAWQPPKMGRPVVDAKPQPAEGTISPAPRDQASPTSSASPEARGVVEPPKPAQKPVRAGSDEIERMHVAIAEFCAWLQKLTGAERMPLSLFECRAGKQCRVAAAHEDRAGAVRHRLRRGGSMNVPEDKIMCLAHAHDRTPRNHKTPPAWCDRYVTCLRHQAISQVPYDGSHTVKPRVCMPGQFDQFLAVDRSEGGKA